MTSGRSFNTREALKSAGAAFQDGLDGTEFALLNHGAGRCSLFQVFSETNVEELCTAPSEADAEARLAVQLDATLHREFDRLCRSMEEREAAVRPSISVLLEAAGYYIEATGGGGLAWQRDIDGEGDACVLLSCNGEIDGDPASESWGVGRYGRTGGWICLDEAFTLADAIAAAARLPSTRLPNGDIVQIVFPTLEEALTRVVALGRGGRSGAALATSEA
jgi:hypothetical protein